MNLIIGFLPPMLTLARHLWYKLRLLRQLAQDGSTLTHHRPSCDVNLPLDRAIARGFLEQYTAVISTRMPPLLGKYLGFMA